MPTAVLTIGRPPKPLTLPLDLVTRKLAIIGMSGAGKTVTATVIAEEMCQAGLPWVVFDPVGVWWGLRVGLAGHAGFPVLIVGGAKADVPLEKQAAGALAELLAAEDACCIIDVSRESKTTWRTFVTDFCDRAMELEPRTPRAIILEEAPELVPQKPMGEQKRSLVAVDRLVRLGRNKGYGVILLSQRFATVQKDVLTQCDNIIAMRSIGKPDRKALREWVGECVQPEPDDPTLEQFLEGLPKLPDGHGWFWSPQWLQRFEQVYFRERLTFHPGATREARVTAKQVTLASVETMAARFRTELSRKRAVTVEAPKSRKPWSEPPVELEPGIETGVRPAVNPEVAELRDRLANTEDNLRIVRTDFQELSGRLNAARAALGPLYQGLAALFADGATAGTPGRPMRADVYAGWKAKLPGPAAQAIDHLVELGGQATRAQLKLLLRQRRSAFQNTVTALTRAGLIQKHGELIKLREL